MTTTPLAERLKQYRWRKLQGDSGKPLDFGDGGINGSVNRDGRIIAINAYHPEHGYVTLTSVPPFPEEHRYQPDAVRAYRREFSTDAGFGLTFDLPIVSREAFLIEDALPLIRLHLEDGTVADCLTYVIAKHKSITQEWSFSRTDEIAHYTGQVWLMRCPYTQLTEGGPASMPSPNSSVWFHRHGMIGIQNQALPFALFVWKAPLHVVEGPDGSILFEDNPEYSVTSGSVDYGLGLTPNDAQLGPLQIRDLGPEYEHHVLNLQLQTQQQRWQGVPDDLTLRRGLVYGFNCAVPFDDEAVCILTDHLLLPLSWNRDAYYVARALLNWHDDMREIVRKHLIWIFERAERVDGDWGRAYLANGRVKDRGFQLDQQIFPLLELVEYVLETNDIATYDRLRPQIATVLEQLMARRADDVWLFPTEETPADDPIAYPYHLSSHILLWRTLTLLARLIDAAPDFDLEHAADGVRDAIQTHFIAEKDGKHIYAYATDGAGGYHFYHDANDMPLAYAPHWGLVAADDPVWLATVDFAFSPANEGGYYDGHLGSVHTRAAWPLGDAQELLIALATGDKAREAKARASLSAAAQWDGALPEAYDPQTHDVVSRHWFAWPNAMLACIDLKRDQP